MGRARRHLIIVCQVCGYTTFAVNHLSLPAPPLSMTTERHGSITVAHYKLA